MADPLFRHLIASRPAKDASPVSIALSALLHVVVIMLAVVISRPIGSIAANDHVTPLIPVPKISEEPPPAPPPQPARVIPRPPVDDVRGFQRLIAPDFIPPDIPPAIASPLTDEREYSGIGVEGGTPDGTKDRTVTPEDFELAPAFTPFTVKPELANRDEVARILSQRYPPLLRDAGIGGTVLVWLLIDENGRVIRTQVKETSGHAAFDDAALDVASEMRFTPAMNLDRNVKVWISLPLTFRTH